MEDRDAAESDDQVNPYETPTDSAVSRPTLSPGISISLALLLLSIIVVAFLFNVGLGIGCLLLSMPAYVRAIYVPHAAGSSPTKLRRIGAFIGSLAVVVLSVVSGCILFFVTCTAGLITGSAAPGSRASTENIVLPLSFLGFIAGFCVIYWVLWPRRRKP